MKNLFVAGQDESTREWVPVAELRQVDQGYELRYTRGAQRLPGFTGLSRMQALDKSYYSRGLFPFFSNRAIPKSRPEFASYVRWLGLDAAPSSPFDLLSVTGGSRATDNYELIAPPRISKGNFELEFFMRGLRYLPTAVLSQVLEIPNSARAFLMKDVQNTNDANALAIRVGQPSSMLLGYVPRYFTRGILRLLNSEDGNLIGRIKRVNHDAPLDMRVLVSLSASVADDFDLFEGVDDFLPLTSSETERVSADLLQRTSLDIDS